MIVYRGTVELRRSCQRMQWWNEGPPSSDVDSDGVFLFGGGASVRGLRLERSLAVLDNINLHVEGYLLYNRVARASRRQRCQ